METENSLVEKPELPESATKYLGLDIVEKLTEVTPSNLISKRISRGGGSVDYIAGHHFIEKLNEIFGFLWSYDIPSWEVQGNQIVVKGQLTVHVPVIKKRTTKKYFKDGQEVIEESVEYEILGLVKTQFGSSEIKRWTKSKKMTDKKGNPQTDSQGKDLYTYKAGDVIDLGDDFKGAGTDALKKTATQFGIFLDIYASKGSDDEGAKGPDEAQVRVLHSRGSQAGMSEEETDKWIEEQLGCPLDKADTLSLMQLVPKLIKLAKEKNSG